ncbi:MAG: S8 family serine peptidase [Deltaproteobacteria bacterium]|nr:S8 family serine peptidase [Deltaproteobacteria bacterium]
MKPNELITLPQDSDPEPAQLHNHIVMMIDGGIDPNHKAYKDKVIASYTLSCTPPSFDAGNAGDLSEMSSDELKKKIIANIKEGDEFEASCELKEGIEISAESPSDDLLSLRDRWNLSIKERKTGVLEYFEAFEIEKYLREDVLQYHGTSTTAMVAYRNPNVKFVLVENKQESSHYPRLLCKQLEEQSPRWNLGDDKDYTNVSIERCRDSESSLLHKLAMKYNVNLVNKSYGISAADVSSMLKQSSCSLELKKPMMTFLAGKEQIKEGIRNKDGMNYDQVPYITIQSAGNEGMAIENRLDMPYCSRYLQHILVGSYNITYKEVSSFSNYGSCVTLFNLGSRVVTSNPLNFLTVTDGTSFSAPLTVRYISFEFDETTPPQDIVRKLKERLDENRFLPPSKHFRYASYDAQAGDLRLADGNNFDPVIVVNSPLDENEVRKVFAK